MQPATNWYERAEIALDLKRYELALQLVMDGLASTPDCASLLALASRIQYARKAYVEAIEFARQAIELDPSSPCGYYWLAQSLLQLPPNQRDRAQLDSAAARVLEINPNCFSSHQLAGYLAWVDGNLAKAERCYRTALELDPENQETLQALSWITRYHGRWNESRELLEKSLAVQPADGYGLRELAWLHLDREDPEAALQAGLAARDLLPTDAGTFDVICQAAFQLKDYDLALQSIRDLQSIDPNNSRVWSCGAQVLVAAGRYHEAYVFARAAVELDPSNWDAHTWLVKAMNESIESQRQPFGRFLRPPKRNSDPPTNPTVTPRSICKGGCAVRLRG